ncbi:GNAT family N-acetyltransferase [Sediminibacillus halophilus]|uniref:Acetyltransferase (GNAT) domain-containing protein n=1 Tax=Sediminibacillus halophilus TaxID=482461 RepID=A0A1G9X3V2_9BACI|nr:GNAT family N-acetyltransferase [Sediminibacillus halophilus]SDM91126.1 Acetyltransferase (GNAT) domain-containing protein [Sediminibacillus halophilus]
MIVHLDHTDPGTAAKLLKVQIPAYRMEAELIKFDGIPPLHDTVRTIQGSRESFLGHLENERLLGALAYEQTNDHYVLSRLFVGPAYFRQGVASSLLQFFLNHVVRESKPVTVTTGTANLPAISFYEKWGFTKIKEITVEQGISLTMLQTIH